MPTSTAKIATPEAARLLKRLSMHWSHKFAVEFDAVDATIPFDATTLVRLHASDDWLLAQVEVADATNLARIQSVVDSHLQRMARAGALDIDWQTDTGASGEAPSAAS